MNSNVRSSINRVLRLGLQGLRRDFQSGQLTVLLLAVGLAVAALASVAFFSDRMRQGLNRDAAQLLGGDLVVVSDHPINPLFIQRAEALGLTHVQSQTFPTMARPRQAGIGAPRLVAVKAVEPGYPLKGQLKLVRVDAAPDSEGRESKGTSSPQINRPSVSSGGQAPATGEVWVDAAVLETMGLQGGDAIVLGQSSFRITQVIDKEPDRGSGFINFAPRLMMSAGDLPATGLVQPASRVTYRLAVVGDSKNIAEYLIWISSEIENNGEKGVRVETLDNGRPEMRQTLDRAENFLNVVAILTALLCAVAVAVSAGGFASRRLNDFALLRVLGLSQAAITASFVVEFGLVGLLASGMGVAAGWGLHHVFVELLSGLLATTLPPPGVGVAWLGMALGVVLMFSFGLPAVLQLAQVPPLRVIRREVGRLRTATWATLVLGALGLAVLLVMLGRDVKLGLMAMGGLSLAVLLFAAAGWAVVRGLRLAAQMQSVHQRLPRWCLLAVRQMTAQPLSTVAQMTALSVGLWALLLLVTLRSDLLASWQQSTPDSAPNRFVINLMPDQSNDFLDMLDASGVKQRDWYPMIRGRLVAINDQPVDVDLLPSERAKNLVNREFNISFSATLPEHNQLVAGNWAAPAGDGGLSMEDGVLKALGLKLGDQLTFDMAGVPKTATITSVRKVDWSSMRANFFVMYPVADLPDVPLTYLAAFKAPEEKGFDFRMLNQFPNVTSVDLTSSIRQVQTVLDQVVAAVEFLFVFALLAGVVVVLSALAASGERRLHDWAVMRALGGSADLLRRMQWAELLLVGLMAGALASAASLLASWALATQVFEFDWAPGWYLPVVGMLLGAALSGLAGRWMLSRVLNQPVMSRLRSTE